MAIPFQNSNKGEQILSEHQFLAYLQSECLNHGVDALQACGGITGRFVPLDLLLFETEPFGELLLCQSRRDPRLNQGGRQLLERVQGKCAPSGAQRLVLSYLLSEALQLAHEGVSLRLAQ